MSHQNLHSAKLCAKLLMALVVAICPKVLGGGVDLQIVLCHYMNAGSVIGMPLGGYTKKIV